MSGVEELILECQACGTHEAVTPDPDEPLRVLLSKLRCLFCGGRYAPWRARTTKGAA